MALKESTKKEQANSYELVVSVDADTFEKAVNAVYKRQVNQYPRLQKGQSSPSYD